MFQSHINTLNSIIFDGITFISKFREIDRFTPVLVPTTESEEVKIKAGRTNRFRFLGNTICKKVV